MASATGKRKVKAPTLPTGFVYDLPSLSRPPHSAPSARALLQDDRTPPPVSPDLELIKLQIEKQHLEIQVLELKAQAKAQSLLSPSSVKPAVIPSLDTVRSRHNADSIEAGLANWDDDFCEIERFSITESQRLPNATPSANNALVPGPSYRSRFYCREWNRTGTCQHQSSAGSGTHLRLLQTP
ncbi:hypothetical protein P5673_031263 [Acropora cervicornis]|uniref:Uncharacterized protein n=1 Tax=Acropora cervicornis TaxID=6130 RepID=A0AAD9PSV8_ACRCE|nr:hypothetical protein P5673_031263 [Acropora cervicornis]